MCVMFLLVRTIVEVSDFSSVASYDNNYLVSGTGKCRDSFPIQEMASRL